MPAIPSSHRDLLEGQFATAVARISTDEDYSFADRVGATYGANLRDHDQPGQARVIVAIRPVRVNAVDMST
jgi:hypothetical protein